MKPEPRWLVWAELRRPEHHGRGPFGRPSRSSPDTAPSPRRPRSRRLGERTGRLRRLTSLFRVTPTRLKDSHGPILLAAPHPPVPHGREVPLPVWSPTQAWSGLSVGTLTFGSESEPFSFCLSRRSRDPPVPTPWWSSGKDDPCLVDTLGPGRKTEGLRRRRGEPLGKSEGGVRRLQRVGHRRN